MEISSELRAGIVAAATASPHEEICGLLLGRGLHVVAVERCRNVAADPVRRFEIDPAALLAAHRRRREGGLPIIGHYHSHPGGVAAPSTRDAADAVADGAIWLIAAGEEITAWRAVSDGAVHGRFDPLAL